MSNIESVKRALRGDGKIGSEMVPAGYLPTGSTMLNLAISGKADGGLPLGTYIFMVGDTDSGKTFLSLTMFAEASINPAFDKYRLIYDGTEGGAMMNIRKFFGDDVAERLEPPAMKDGEPYYSVTAQEFYYHVDDAIAKGIPFIYVLDSQDALSSDEEQSKFDEKKKAHRKGKEVTGTYGDAKAKIHSANIRKLISPLREMKSILVIVNQTRDSFSMFEAKTYSGGRALAFYAALILWSSSAGKLKRTVKGKPRQLGVSCKVRVKKNRVSGRDRSIVIPIYHSYGIDDLGGCVDYLVEEGIWSKEGTKIVVSGIGPGFTGTPERVIEWIEDEGKEQDVRELVEQTWNDIEEACVVKRKSRY